MTKVKSGRPMLAACMALIASGCGDRASLPESAGTGPNPALPPPHHTLIPTIDMPHAVGWPAHMKPIAAPGLAVSAYATGLDHPRSLHVLPNGDVLVAESSGIRPEDEKGPMAWMEERLMRYVGEGGVSADRITLLRGRGAGGAAQERSVLLKGLHSPFGMALVGSSLYVANTDAVVRFPYTDGTMMITEPGTKVLALPHGRQGHWTRDLIASPDGTRLYVTIGSNSNVAEGGLESEAGRAAIHELDLGTGRSRIFASGLRNPNGLAWEPSSGALWVAVNERDELGSDLVPDYMTSVRDGGFYGWPYSYFGGHVDGRVRPPRPDLVATAIVPDYALGNHTAALGLVFYESDALPRRYRGGAFIGQHGSWNRRPPSGYKVVFVPFSEGRPAGEPQDVLTGFLSPDGQAYGRPVGLAVDRDGALLVADDAGNTVWRVSAQGSN